MTERHAKPPRHLSAQARTWWRYVIETFRFEAHDLPRLQIAGELWDLKEALRKDVEKNGRTYLDRFQQPRSRPEVGDFVRATIAYNRSMRELRLDVAPDDARVPGLAGGREHA